MESPFYLLYGRDPRLPNDAVLSPTKAKKLIGLREYGQELTVRMSEAWELARQSVGRAQKKQKQYYDQRQQRLPNFTVGERVFLFKPAEKTGEARKFARPYHGPYRVLEVDINTVRMNRPQEEPILVAIDRLRRCPAEVADEFCPPDKSRKKKGVSSSPGGPVPGLPSDTAMPETAPWPYNTVSWLYIR